MSVSSDKALVSVLWVVTATSRQAVKMRELLGPAVPR